MDCPRLSSNRLLCIPVCQILVNRALLDFYFYFILAYHSTISSPLAQLLYLMHTLIWVWRPEHHYQFESLARQCMWRSLQLALYRLFNRSSLSVLPIQDCLFLTPPSLLRYSFRYPLVPSGTLRISFRCHLYSFNIPLDSLMSLISWYLYNFCSKSSMNSW